MDNIIPFYAYPRSGATLLSTLLNNHPDFIVSPEMYSIKTPTSGEKDWTKFLIDDKNSHIEAGGA